MRYVFLPGVFSTVLAGIKAMDVHDESGRRVGAISRGEIPGCERAGTFRFEPLDGPATDLGIQSITRSWVKRLLRPDYVVSREGAEHRLSDRLGENLLYFAVAGQLDGCDYSARQDWDDTVAVTVDGALAARWDVDDVTGGVAVDVAPAGAIADENSLPFAVTLLMPFMQMIHSDESELVESLFD